MESKGFQLIPTDVIKAWSKGDYYVGDIPSISYQHLGIALQLRGWYTYFDEGQDRAEWAGVAKVDIKGSVLSMGGIRLFGAHPIFWRTEHSYIPHDKEIIWFYSGVNCEVPGRIRDKYVRTGWSLDRTKPENRFGMDDKDWRNLLGTLATDFDDDVEGIIRDCPREKIDRGMLHFSVDLDNERRVVPDNEIPGRKCKYYHFVSDTGMPANGVSIFEKIKVKVLDELP